jgi:hypothetical protein
VDDNVYKSNDPKLNNGECGVMVVLATADVLHDYFRLKATEPARCK